MAKSRETEPVDRDLEPALKGGRDASVEPLASGNSIQRYGG